MTNWPGSEPDSRADGSTAHTASPSTSRVSSPYAAERAAHCAAHLGLSPSSEGTGQARRTSRASSATPSTTTTVTSPSSPPVFSRLTHHYNDSFRDRDRLEVARTYVEGNDLGRLRVWAADTGDSETVASFPDIRSAALAQLPTDTGIDGVM